MLCKNRITLIGFVGQDAETRSIPNGNQYTRFSLATSVSWKENGESDYKTRTEWHRVICWNKVAEWAGNLHKGAYVEVEGELRYREYTPAESTAAFVWQKSMRARFWRWTAPPDRPAPVRRNQIRPTNRSGDRTAGHRTWVSVPGPFGRFKTDGVALPLVTTHDLLSSTGPQRPNTQLLRSSKCACINLTITAKRSLSKRRTLVHHLLL